MTIVNAGFERYTREPHKRTVWEQLNKQGLDIPLPADAGGTREFRALVEAHKPAGEGWRLMGYAIIEET